VTKKREELTEADDVVKSSEDICDIQLVAFL
jgi:hypothetical protein